MYMILLCTWNFHKKLKKQTRISLKGPLLVKAEINLALKKGELKGDYRNTNYEKL